MLPFELVATATDSPRFSPGGSLRKFGTDVTGMAGTPVIVAFAWANAGPAVDKTTAAHAAARHRFMGTPRPGAYIRSIAASIRSGAGIARTIPACRSVDNLNVSCSHARAVVHDEAQLDGSSP